VEHYSLSSQRLTFQTGLGTNRLIATSGKNMKLRKAMAYTRYP
jgi:hypothetical protein